MQSHARKPLFKRDRWRRRCHRGVSRREIVINASSDQQDSQQNPQNQAFDHVVFLSIRIPGSTFRSQHRSATVYVLPSNSAPLNLGGFSEFLSGPHRPSDPPGISWYLQCASYPSPPTSRLLSAY